MDEEYKKKSEEEAPIASWQTIYCSLVLILVALFAMLASYSTIESKKIKHFLHGKVPIENDKSGGGSDILQLSQDVMEGPDKSVVIAMESLGRYLSETGLDKSVSIERDGNVFKAIFANNVFFPSGMAVLNEQAYPCLNAIIKVARRASFSIRVEGHTDNIPINTSRFPSNWELSTTRAVNVLRYLLEKGELPSEKLTAVGFSRYHPVESNATSEGRQKNRRVEFYFAK